MDLGSVWGPGQIRSKKAILAFPMATIICPACGTRYEIKAVLPPEGRKVRCSKCAHVWQAKPLEMTPDAGPAQKRAPAAMPPQPPPPPRPAFGNAGMGGFPGIAPSPPTPPLPPRFSPAPPIPPTSEADLAAQVA